MKVTQQKLPASQLSLEIEIPSDISQKTYDRTLAKFKQSANIPGFRKGKVPQQILVRRLGVDRLKAAALEDMIQSSLEKAIEQENIDALGNYQLSSSFEELVANYTPGQTLTFSATVDVPPDVNVNDYTGLEIQAEEIPYDVAKVDAFFEERRSEHANLIPVENRPAQMGDVLTVDYEGKLVSPEGEESEPFPGGTAEDTQIELNEGRFIAGFVENLVGLNAEETKTFDVTFPEDYPNEDLAGEQARFTVTVKDIKEKELPELDDDFAQTLSDYDTMQELRESIEKQFKEEAESQTTANIEKAIVETLIERVEVELPETLVKQEVDVMLTQTAMQLQQYGLDVQTFYTPENLPQLRERSRPEAIEKLKQDLGLKKIAEVEQLKPSDDEIQTRMDEVREQLSDRDIDETRLRSFVEDELVSQKALDWLRERAKIELVPEGTLSESEEDEVEAESDVEASESAE
ncbi:trigger factor [Leptolyngbya valderiana BDU 20041]|nr:trigger factor [Leptolyngbya valderiana BDU 20041]PPT05408.1 Cell division trigger factor [Geitlerinema sp. FC II]